MSQFNRSHFPIIFPAAWAKSWGQDKFGLFMVMEFKGVQQCFRWITPGSFMMGSPDTDTEPERDEDEIQHQVTLSQGYWLADTACTQALWQAMMGDNPSEFKDSSNNPVEDISWNDAQGFIQQINHGFPEICARLPTEAEWEIACRAGTDTPFSFGDTINTDQVNYDGNYPYAGAAKGEYRQKTVAVKTLPPNPWGLYEMHGNVWEWCQDCYGHYLSKSVSDPQGPETGSDRVLRGGSWSSGARGARSAYRGRSVPVGRGNGIGFRLALGENGVSPVQQKSRQPVTGLTVAAESDGQAGQSVL